MTVPRPLETRQPDLQAVEGFMQICEHRVRTRGSSSEPRYRQ